MSGGDGGEYRRALGAIGKAVRRIFLGGSPLETRDWSRRGREGRGGRTNVAAGEGGAVGCEEGGANAEVGVGRVARGALDARF